MYIFLCHWKARKSECLIMHWQHKKGNETVFTNRCCWWSLICNTCWKQWPTAVHCIGTKFCHDRVHEQSAGEMVCACTVVQCRFFVAVEEAPLLSINFLTFWWLIGWMHPTFSSVKLSLPLYVAISTMPSSCGVPETLRKLRNYILHIYNAWYQWYVELKIFYSVNIFFSAGVILRTR